MAQAHDECGRGHNKNSLMLGKELLSLTEERIKDRHLHCSDLA